MKHLLVALFIAAWSNFVTAQSDASISRPQIKVGDSWTYRGLGILSAGTDIYETKVVRVDENTVQAVSTRRGDGREFDSTYTPHWAAVVSVAGFITKPPTSYLQFPLQIGAKRQVMFEVSHPRMGNFRAEFQVTLTVVEWEQVTVPAGSFNAVKVVAEEKFHRLDTAGTGESKTTFWYVPKVKRWVKYVGETGVSRVTRGEELLDFKVQ